MWSEVFFLVLPLLVLDTRMGWLWELVLGVIFSLEEFFGGS
jgi:hypothetical protein